MNNLFGQHVRELREERNLSQKELAKEFNVDFTTISHWENACQEPSFDMLIQIARFFEVSTDYLLGLEN